MSAERATAVWRPAWPQAEGEEYARALHLESFGHAPSGAASAPGRITVVGEHTDINGGPTLSTAIHHRAYVAYSVRDDDEVHVACDIASGDDRVTRWQGSLYDIDAGQVAGCPALAAGTLWGLMERGYLGPGLNLAIRSCIPAATGLGESAAIEVAVARAVDKAWGLRMEGPKAEVEMADACVDAENEIVGGFAGGLDQFSSMFGRHGEGLLLDFATYPPRITTGALDFGEYGLGLLVVDTSARLPGDDERPGQRRADCANAATALGVHNLREVADAPHPLDRLVDIEDDTVRRRARHAITEMQRVRTVTGELERAGSAIDRFTTIGHALSASHASLRDDFEVSCPELDLAVEAANHAGALGSRMVGGGFGGCIITLVRKSTARRKADAIAAAFAEAGFAPPAFLAFDDIRTRPLQ